MDAKTSAKQKRELKDEKDEKLHRRILVACDAIHIAGLRHLKPRTSLGSFGLQEGSLFLMESNIVHESLILISLKASVR